MSQPDASDSAAAKQNTPAGSSAGVDADQWAKAVVDGVPTEAADPTSADQTAPVDQPAESHDPAAEIQDPAADGDAVDGDVAAGDGVEGESEGEVSSPDDNGATNAAPSADEESVAGDISVEDLVIDLERVTTERDQYLDASRRLQAEFENYKKQVVKREAEARERANDSLVGELLPVLDAFDGALANGAEDVAPMRTSFLDAMAKQGLERIDPTDVPFDPTLHEAVMHEEASDVDGPVVAEVMRAGYVWKGRVLRPAMVRTRG